MKHVKSLFSKCVYILLLCTFFYAGYQLVLYGNEEIRIYRVEKQLTEEREKLAETGYDFKPLRKKNADTAAWLRIEGTSIDYPIVQASDNEFYLNHDFNKNKSKAGSIFMDCRNGQDLEDRNTILYGHNMKNGTMFRDLNNYGDYKFLHDHRYIELYTVSFVYTWEIFSTYRTGTDFNYLLIEFSSSEDFYSYIDTVAAKSQFELNENLKSTEQVLTLSTCSGGSGDMRRVVHARLIGKEKLPL